MTWFLGSSPSQNVPGCFQEVQVDLHMLRDMTLIFSTTYFLWCLHADFCASSVWWDGLSLRRVVAGSYYSFSHFGLRGGWHCSSFCYPLWITGQGHVQYLTSNWDQAVEQDWTEVSGIVKGLCKAGYNLQFLPTGFFSFESLFLEHFLDW